MLLQDNALRVSKRLTNKPRQPVQLAADVVERVMATQGDLYLQTKQHELRWWQLSMLDVYAVVALVTLVPLGVIAYIIRAVFSAII